ncbi:uncharacterized protein LOC131038693 isoform X1 [Cryptomeria japonica]|uniref:uncharacterized protein LOC131038693 isoform X1 n=1 Tax=Cryptomeria japonica TaxID=3369 RepID=UPI0027DA4F67|nr:uncharacterized protein LOC131038693 isoform X1 [Cryptomeria japonica]
MDKNPLSLFAKMGAVAVGGLVTLSFTSSLVIGGIRNVTEAKRKKTAPPCSVCNGRGFMQCKLCGGRATIDWSPLYDPVISKLCVCPTCEGNRKIASSQFAITHSLLLSNAAIDFPTHGFNVVSTALEKAMIDADILFPRTWNQVH